MARTFSTPSFYVDHEPDYSLEDDGNGGKARIELPGFVEIGVEVDGVKVPLKRLKGGLILPRIDAAKAKAKADAAAAPPPPPES